MKKLLTLIACLCLFAFATVKKYELTEGQMTMLYQALEVSKKAIPTSETVSAREASGALMAIDSIQKVLYKQYADSTKNK